MSYKRSTLRLFVAVTGLIAAVLEFVTAAVRLGGAILERATRRVAPRAQATVAEPAWVPQAPARALPATGPDEEKLQNALMSLKFPAARVRAFTASCRGRTEGLDVLVKEGIQQLASC